MGTYTALNMKSINDENKLIVHKNARNMSDLLDDSSKKIIKKSKNKIILEVYNNIFEIIFLFWSQNLKNNSLNLFQG